MVLLVKSKQTMARLSNKLCVYYTDVDLVFTGPCPELSWYWLKYCATERPMKREYPKINFDLKLLRWQNWRKLKPAAAEPEIQNQMVLRLQ